MVKLNYLTTCLTAPRVTAVLDNYQDKKITTCLTAPRVTAVLDNYLTILKKKESLKNTYKPLIPLTLGNAVN